MIVAHAAPTTHRTLTHRVLTHRTVTSASYARR